jgi:protein-disulfide isomerase
MKRFFVEDFRMRISIPAPARVVARSLVACVLLAGCGGGAKDTARDSAVVSTAEASVPPAAPESVATVGAPAAGRVATPPAAAAEKPSPAFDAGEATAEKPAVAPEAADAPAAGGDTVDLRRLGFDRGRADAPVVVVEFSDFGCPFCASFSRDEWPVLEREFVTTGRVRWKHVPFVAGMFPNSDQAARAAECAGQQGKFWPMHDLLFARQREWKGSGGSEAVFQAYARQAGLDAARFSACWRSPAAEARVRASTRAADAAFVRATPSFLVNGRLVEGALPLEDFRQVLRAAAGGSR